MVRVQKNIIVGTSAQAIWNILDNPAKSSCLNPNFKLVYCYESRLGGYDHVFRYCMGGKTLEAGSQMLAYQCGTYMAYKTCGDLHSTWHWWLEGDGRNTHVSLTVDYRMPKALDDVAAWEIEEENERVLARQMANLKRVAETR